MTPQELSSDAIPENHNQTSFSCPAADHQEVSVTQTNKARFSSIIDVLLHSAEPMYKSSPPVWERYALTFNSRLFDLPQ
jgi:hypothetical protein